MKSLPKKAKGFLLTTITVGFLVAVLPFFQFEPGQVWAVLALTTAASLALIFKVEGATNRSHYNISFLVYGFAFLLLDLPGAAVVVLASNLVEWAWNRSPWFIQAFNISSYLLALHFAAFIYGLVSTLPAGYRWLEPAAVLMAMGSFTFVNHAMVALIVFFARGENLKQSGIFDLFPFLLDFILLVMGAGAAIVWQVNPFAVVLPLLPLYLIYATLRVPALERQTETDPKTGLFNARFFMQSLETELERCNRFDRSMTVVMADLDLLRNINNTYGHLAGDEVLVGIARILKQSMRDVDIVARFGGEEFAILMPECSPAEAFDRIDPIRQAIEKTEFSVPTSITAIKATISLGIAGRDTPGQKTNEIIHNADTALYHAKLTGRNRTCIYSEESFNALFGSTTAQKLSPAEERARYEMPVYPSEPARAEPSS